MNMDYQKLDHFFPYFVFFYGVLVVFVLENKTLDSLGKARISTLYEGLQRHRALAWICLFVGGIWSLQNLWLGT